MKKVQATVAAWILVCAQALANSYASYHDLLVGGLRSGMELLASTKQNALPTNLFQLAPFLNWDGLEAISKRPIAERFLLLNEVAIEYPPGSKGRLLVVSQYPIEDGRYPDGLIRHLVWREEKGGFRHGKAYEAELQPLFEAAGTVLPPGPVWVEQVSPEHIAKARGEQSPNDGGASPAPGGKIARRVTEVQGQEPKAAAASAVPDGSAAPNRAGGRGGISPGWVAGGGLAAALGFLVVWFFRQRRRRG